MESTKSLNAASAMLHADVFDEHPAVDHAHRMFRRLVASWASDMMYLRRLGLDAPSHRPGDSVPALGAEVASVTARRAA
ncbi:MAG: hypothetical protein KF684_10745 [Phycisphaeraceae bacterium]|nr:hypothetical protein [Phycisphaeraceae bacterium]